MFIVKVYIISILFQLLITIETSSNSFDNVKVDSNDVPSPWIPIKVLEEWDRITVECWGRQYIFDNSVLPSQIISQGTKLLNSPIQVNLIKHNNFTAFEKVFLSVKRKTAQFVELEGQLRSVNKSSGKVVVNANIRIEYDGLIVFNLTCASNIESNSSSFGIEIPYSKKVAKYYLKWTRTRHVKYSGVLPTQTGKFMNDTFTPFYLVGNNKVGLFWFCESTLFWPNANRNDAIKFVCDDKELTQILNIGNTNRYEFGLQATPVKPLPKKWRSWHLASTSYADIADSSIVYLEPYPGKINSTKYYGWPEAVNEGAYKKMVDEYHSNNKKVIAYQAITRLPSNSDFFKGNSSNWTIGEIGMRYKGDTLKYVEPSSIGYADSIANNFASYMTRYELDGFYLDGIGIYPYWRRKGNNLSYYPIMAYRELQKKLYIALKKVNSNAIIIAHMSARMNIPVLTYVDAYVDGEQFRYSENGKNKFKVNKSYLDVISLEQFRAEFIGKQWGIVPFFLPELPSAKWKTIQPTLGLAALLLQHDVQPFLIGSSQKVWKSMYAKLDSFGIVNADFIPYYSQYPPGEASKKGVYVSAYSKKNGQTLLIVSNLSKQAYHGKIRMTMPKYIGDKSINILSMSNGIAIPYKRNEFVVHIDPSSYKMFWIK